MPHAGDTAARPLLGGTRIECRSPVGGLRVGTVGFAIVREGTPLLVTAARAVFGPGAPVGQPATGDAVGRVHECMTGRGAGLALVRLHPGVRAAPRRVWTGPGSSVEVEVARVRPPVGSRVVLQGAEGGAVEGRVEEVDWEVVDPASHQRVHGALLVRWARPPAPGDVGGPVLEAVRDGAACWGVLGGWVAREEGLGWVAPLHALPR